MKGIGRAAAALALALVLASSLGVAAPQKKKVRTKPVPADFDVRLPVLGTQLAPLPEGEGKAIAEQACLQCHSTSMILQQRLTEKQWTASIDKMIRWGAAVPADRKDALIAYLAVHFGPDNDRFEPTVTRPVGK